MAFRTICPEAESRNAVGRRGEKRAPFILARMRAARFVGGNNRAAKKKRYDKNVEPDSRSHPQHQTRLPPDRPTAGESPKTPVRTPQSKRNHPAERLDNRAGVLRLPIRQHQVKEATRRVAFPFSGPAEPEKTEWLYGWAEADLAAPEGCMETCVAVLGRWPLCHQSTSAQAMKMLE